MFSLATVYHIIILSCNLFYWIGCQASTFSRFSVYMYYILYFCFYFYYRILLFFYFFCLGFSMFPLFSSGIQIYFLLTSLFNHRRRKWAGQILITTSKVILTDVSTRNNWPKEEQKPTIRNSSIFHIILYMILPPKIIRNIETSMP